MNLFIIHIKNELYEFFKGQCGFFSLTSVKYEPYSHDFIFDNLGTTT